MTPTGTATAGLDEFLFRNDGDPKFTVRIEQLLATGVVAKDDIGPRTAGTSGINHPAQASLAPWAGISHK